MKIGIIRIDKMGDMILTLPIIKAIKMASPSTKIHVFGSKRNIKVIEHFKYIDKIFNLDKKNNRSFEKYDFILNFSPGWKSFFLCFFSKATKKANIIYTSRYNDKSYSKLLISIFSKIFFYKTQFIDRIKRYKKNQPIHQTKMMFELLDKCEITYKSNLLIENFLPNSIIVTSQKKICLIHLSSRWINNYYTEEDFLNLITKLKKKFNLALTTDNTTKEKFKLIFEKFLIIKNERLSSFNTLNQTTIFENLSFENWIKVIYASSLVITPECGCTHIAAVCKIPSKIIYDPDNKPHMIYQEYAPWNSKHEKYIFNYKNLNLLLTQKL